MSTRPGIRMASITASLALGALLGCGGGGGSSAPPASAAPAVSVSVAPEQPLQTTLRPQTFKATVTGTENTAVTWSVVSGGGSIDPRTGVYVAPDHPGTVVVKAQSVADPARAATAAVTVVPAPTIAGFTASKAIIPFGGSAVLTPTFATDGTAVVTPSLGGAVTSGTGYAVSPAAITSYTLTVTNSAGTSVAATVTVDVLTAQVSVAPAAATVTAGTTQQFNAVVGGAVNTGVTWSATGGAVSASGLFTAPATPGTYAVVASSAADPSKSVLASVKVVAAPAIASFSAAKTTLSKGSGTVLSYSFTGGTGVLDHGVGTVVSGGTANVAPDDSTKYTLTVTNEAGAMVGRQVSVAVVPPPDATVALGAGTPAPLPSRTSGFRASVPAQAGCTYAWSLPAAQGTITAGAGTPAVTFSTLDGGQALNLQCTVTNAAGDAVTGSVSAPVARRWQPLAQVPGTAGKLTFTMDSALDDNGTQWYLFGQALPDASGYGLYAVRYAGSWGAPVRLDSASGITWNPFGYVHLATDNKGRAMAVWHQYDTTLGGSQLWAARFDGAVWGPATRLDRLSGAGTVRNSAVGMDGAGQADVIWTQRSGGTSDDIRVRLFAVLHNGTGWTDPVQIDGNGSLADKDVSPYCEPVLAVDPSGHALAAWATADYTGTTYTSTAALGHGVSGWDAPIALSTPIPWSRRIDPVLAVATDRQGHGMVAYTNVVSDQTLLGTRRFSLAGGPSFGEVVAARGGSPYPFPVVTSLSLAPGGKGNLGYFNYGDYELSYALALDPASDTWGYPSLLGGSGYQSRDPRIASAAGSTFGVWMAETSQGLLQASYQDPASGYWASPVLLSPGLGSVLRKAQVRTYPSGIGLAVAFFEDATGYHIYTAYYR